MVSRLTPPSLCACLIALACVSVSAEGLDQYREFTLGSSTSAVAALTTVNAADLKTLHERPALLQDLSWRPRYAARRPIPDVDPVLQMVFSFYNDELYRIAIEYDKTRTAGLTNADMVAALTAVYGTPDTLVAPTRASRQQDADPSAATLLVANWQREDTRLSLFWSDYRQGFSLVMASTRLGALARTAATQAVDLDNREAPAREAARVKQQAADDRAAGDKARTANKEGFRP
jgi:hypothetical protein